MRHHGPALAGALALLCGCHCNEFQANAPSHEAAFGGAFGAGHDPCDELGAYMVTGVTGDDWVSGEMGVDNVAIVFGASRPVLAFAWLDAVELDRSYAAIDFTLHGEAGWLADELGWEDENGDWAPDLVGWTDEQATRNDYAVLSAGRLSFTEELGTDDDGYPRYRVEGNLVWGNPALASAAWYSWEGKDVWPSATSPSPGRPFSGPSGLFGGRRTRGKEERMRIPYAILALPALVACASPPEPDELYGLWQNVDAGTVRVFEFAAADDDADLAGLTDIFHIYNYPEGTAAAEVMRGTFVIAKGDGWELVTTATWTPDGTYVGQSFGNPIAHFDGEELELELDDGTTRLYTATASMP